MATLNILVYVYMLSIHLFFLLPLFLNVFSRFRAEQPVIPQTTPRRLIMAAIESARVPYSRGGNNRRTNRSSSVSKSSRAYGIGGIGGGTSVDGSSGPRENRFLVPADVLNRPVLQPLVAFSPGARKWEGSVPADVSVTAVKEVGFVSQAGYFFFSQPYHVQAGPAGRVMLTTH